MIKTKIVNQTALTKLYSLNEYQKSFATRITFKVEMIDTFNINIIYNIPLEAKLIFDFDLNSFNEEINKTLFGKPADYINAHLVVLEIIMETFNSHLIGVCLNKEIEDTMLKQIIKLIKEKKFFIILKRYNMFFRKKEKKIFYPFAYELAESVSPMLAREFELWYEKDEKAFLNIISFFYFLKSNIKLFKKCDKEDLSYYFLISFEKRTPEIKKIIDDLSEELCFNGKLNRDIHYYLEELNRINGY